MDLAVLTGHPSRNSLVFVFAYKALVFSLGASLPLESFLHQETHRDVDSHVACAPGMIKASMRKKKVQNQVCLFVSLQRKASRCMSVQQIEFKARI